ncbi:hypothetical protein LTR27_004522 [Elasticomyces elasticus]|nr:hypothetical protein LTR27_004522 [Elasticomyces elasticus]
MSWAAKRQRTRLEDVAYSLLGIFGVNMPLLYGEGSKAFARLQTEIIKVSTNPSIFAWSIDRSSGLSSAYELNNEGLRISLPIVKCLRYTCALLDCSLQNDMTGPLALLIIPVPGNPGLYTVSASGNAGIRLATVPLETIALNVERAPITILASSCVKVTEKPSSSTHTYYRVHATDQRARIALVNVWPSEQKEGSSHNGTDFSDASEVITTISGMSIPDERSIVRVLQFAFSTKKDGKAPQNSAMLCSVLESLMTDTVPTRSIGFRYCQLHSKSTQYTVLQSTQRWALHD